MVAEVLSERPEDPDCQGGRDHRERLPRLVSQSEGTHQANRSIFPASEGTRHFKSFQIPFPAKGTKLGSGGEGSMAEAESWRRQSKELHGLFMDGSVSATQAIAYDPEWLCVRHDGKEGLCLGNAGSWHRQRFMGLRMLRRRWMEGDASGRCEVWGQRKQQEGQRPLQQLLFISHSPCHTGL